MNRYFLKINGERHTSNGICRPKKGQWDGALIYLKKEPPLMVTPGRSHKAPFIRKGDELWIWTHESSEHGNGRGLTAKSVAGWIGEHDNQIAVMLEEVDLLEPPLGLEGTPIGSTNSRLLEHVRSHRHRQVYLIEDQDFEEMMDWVAAQTKTRLRQIEEWTLQNAGSARQRALVDNAGDILEAVKKRRLGLLKIRENQGAFRKAQLNRHNCRCVLSRCDTIEVLEAAHVVPHTGAAEFEVPENGLLLRADLHKLFDRYLWSINPKTGRVSLSNSLKSSSYSGHLDQEVTHKLAPEFLKHHFDLFRAKSS
ncbi:HNH endonuclease [Ruegeria arenilitoris]|uniref:HNH endonuclease n=1 Tax=Ruegeria arenilitoris TaxID=1173585 RepID=UPI00147BBDB9|nr:HNH endonuclease signature motif containing protein [Ruegeria arenilitoris]